MPRIYSENNERLNKLSKEIFAVFATLFWMVQGKNGRANKEMIPCVMCVYMQKMPSIEAKRESNNRVKIEWKFRILLLLKPP